MMKRIISTILVFAMLLTFVPVAFAETNFLIEFETSVDTIAPGGSFDMTGYLSGANGGNVALGVADIEVTLPAGFTAVVKEQGSSEVSIKGNTIVFWVEDEGDSTIINKNAPLGTVTITAPETEGVYDFEYTTVEFYNGAYDEYDPETVECKAIGMTVADKVVTPDEPTAPELPEGYEFYITLDGKTEVAPGEAFDVTGYLAGPDGADIALGVADIEVTFPAGFAVAVKEQGSSEVSVKGNTVVFWVEDEGDATIINKNAPLGTVTVTAPATVGDYALEYSTVEFYNGAYDEYDPETVYCAPVTIKVAGGSIEPPVVDPKPSLVVNPTAIEVPYGADVVEYIKANAKVYYYADVNAEAADVTADAVITEDGVVTYKGLTANIAVTKVTLVDIVLSTLEKIVVPYGTADVKTYVEAEAAKIEVTAKYSNNTSAVVPATVEYAGNVVTISYDGIAKTVEVEEIKAVAIGVVPNTDIVVPYGSDVAEYIKTAVRVQVETSDGAKVAPLGEVAVVDNGDGTATVTADGCEATVTYTIGANPEDIASIEVTAGELVVPYGADAAAYIAANVTVTATKNSGDKEVIGITAENVVPVDGVATITVDGCEATVNYTVETIKGIVAAVEALDLAWDADVEAAVKAVAVYYVYSANTANSVVPAEEITYEIKDTEAVITVGEFTATIALNIAAKPAYFVEEVAPAYDLDGHKAIVISMNVEGVPYVNGVAAVKVADAKFVFVTDEEYTIEVKEETADIVAWGTLHRDDMVTALDALMALNAADGVIADEFKADDNTYIKADIDLNYDITATDALGINNISLGKTTVVTMAE